MLRFLALIVCALTFASVAQAGGGTESLNGGYRYNGQRVCARSTVVTLKAAVVFPGKWTHAAVWSGVFAGGSQAWVQAGVTQDETGAPYVYLEWSTQHGAYKLVRIRDGRSARIDMVQRGNVWTLTVGGRTATVKLGAQTRCFAGAESEDWSQRNVVRGTVTADGRTFGVAL